MTKNSKGYVVASDEGSHWDMGPGWPGRPAIFKLLNEQTGGGISVFEEVVPSGAGTSLHIHRTCDEAINVISGEFTVRLGEENHRATDGAWIFIPMGSVHGWRNSGPGNGRLSFIFAPGEGALAFEEMHLLKMPIQDIDPVTRDAIFERAGFEFVTWDWK